MKRDEKPVDDSDEKDGKNDTKEDDSKENDTKEDDSKENNDTKENDDDDDSDEIRSRDHIEEILRIEEIGSVSDKEEQKLIDSIFRDLKRIYESSIKPLELLYKYRSITNRLIR